MSVKKVEKTCYSFKDLSARVVKSEGIYKRYVHNSYKGEFEHLMNSGLYDVLVEKQYIIPHIVDEVNQLPTGYFVRLVPQQIPFLVEPFEWTFSEWKQALLIFLEINKIALTYGMILKDATPYNFAKVNGKMLLFDTTSFKYFTDNDSWIAYRQFCVEFFGPLALMKYYGSDWSRLTRPYVKGLPLNFISRLLPIASYMNFQCLLHLHFHSRFQPKSQNGKDHKSSKGFTRDGLNLMMNSISKSVLKWNQKDLRNSLWDHYYDNEIEHASYLANKSNVIIKWLELVKPVKVADLGANIGHFSLLASNYCENVIAIENNVECVEILNNTIDEKGIRNITTAVADLTQLSPDLGNGFKEIRNLGIRGKSDVAFALALIHHLCITFSFSFDQVIELCKQFSSNYLVIEFVHKDDKQAQSLLDTLPDTFDDYTQVNFEKALSKSFDLIEKVTISDTQRVLYLAKLIHD